MGRPWFACEYDGCEAEGWRRVEEQMVDERGRKLPQRIRYWLCQAHHPQGRSAPAMPAKRPERSRVALAVEKAIQSRPVPAAPVLEAMRPSVVVSAPARCSGSPAAGGSSTAAGWRCRGCARRRWRRGRLWITYGQMEVRSEQRRPLVFSQT